MKERVLITGASSGIGLELARLAAAEGCDLVLVARSADRLEQLATELRQSHSVEVTVLPSDLTRPEAPGELVAELEKRQLPVDILVNNAGFATYGPFAETDRRAELDMLQLNMVALTDLTKLLLPPMIARGHGRVMNVASTAAFQPGPLMAVYYATKAYVLSLSEALANELKDQGVSVTAFCPGPTESGFQAAAGMQKSRLVQRKLPTSAEVARVGWAATRRGQAVCVPGTMNWIYATAIRFLPRSLVTSLVRKAQAPS
ncbi:MAG: ketoacyl reductase [Candidatus Xenobia bacterium]